VGINVAAASRTAARLGPGHTIVTVALRTSGDAAAPASTNHDWPAARGSASPGDAPLIGRGQPIEKHGQRGTWSGTPSVPTGANALKPRQALARPSDQLREAPIVLPATGARQNPCPGLQELWAQLGGASPQGPPASRGDQTRRRRSLGLCASGSGGRTYRS